MRGRLLVMLAGILAGPVAAETVVATRTIRPATVLAPGDVATVEAVVPGALSDADAAIGLEARTTLFAGRPIRPTDLGPPTLVERNQIVALAFESGGLAIRAEGRALTRGSRGEVVRVLNLASRQTVTGIVRDDGVVVVGSGR
jgi:flagella basal body P-ring formation protein FlgA